MLKVTLVKSKIANTPANRATVKALGLNKIGSSNTFDDSASIRGMIHKVKHLLKVEEIEGGEVVRRRRDGKALAEKRAAKSAARPAPAKKAVASAVTAPKAKAPKKEAAAKAPAKAAAKKTTSAEAKPKRTTKKKSEEA
ncbi:MAG: 50S ribosomal protein L30 [Fimbriimonadaceae bacterium]|nr:MAG: 50S ribosomal protein L30 [Fimbriimonadaceae bacterium]